MNLCVTLNPCLDKTLDVPAWKPGEHQVRGRAFGQVVGGKGVNVARALVRLGHTAQPALFLGGELGRLCERLLREQDGFEPLVTWTAAPTREILTVRTESSAEQTAFFDPNPTIAASERDAFVSQVTAAFSHGTRWCAMSGSSPCAVTDDVYAQLVRSARRSGVSTVVDTYGACFPLALAAAPDVIKLNCLECEQAFGTTLDTPAAIETAVRRMRGAGAGSVAITFGSRGMVRTSGGLEAAVGAAGQSDRSRRRHDGRNCRCAVARRRPGCGVPVGYGLCRGQRRKLGGV